MRICCEGCRKHPIFAIGGGRGDKTSESMRWWQRPAPLLRISPARAAAAAAARGTHRAGTRAFKSRNGGALLFIRGVLNTVFLNSKKKQKRSTKSSE
jgi:hypothetical protein